MSNNLPEWTAQAFVAAGAVFLLISAYWMGVYVPNAKELSDDFESEVSFDGDTRRGDIQCIDTFGKGK